MITFRDEETAQAPKRTRLHRHWLTSVQKCAAIKGVRRNDNALKGVDFRRFNRNGPEPVSQDLNDPGRGGNKPTIDRMKSAEYIAWE